MGRSGDRTGEYPHVLADKVSIRHMNETQAVHTAQKQLYENVRGLFDFED